MEEGAERSPCLMKTVVSMSLALNWIKKGRAGE
jgi:hypothetical protein